MASEDEGEPAPPTPERMRIAASLRANAIALVQPGFVLVLALPNLEPVAELGIPGDLDDHDVGFTDDTGRILVLSRNTRTSVLHVVDPSGPTKLGELEFRVPTRIACIAGAHVLVVSGGGLSVVDVNADRLAAPPLPIRGHCTATGRLGPDHFVLTIGGNLEDWDARKRAPGRRLKLEHSIDPLHVGGNAQQVWLVPRKQPEVIDVISMAARSTRRIELPEPVESVMPHPNGYVLAMIGATTHNAFVVDLTRSKSVMRVDGGVMTDVAWLGHSPTLVVKRVGGPIELVTIAMPDQQADVREVIERAAPEPPPVVRPPQRSKRVSEVPATRWSRQDITRRLAAWRERNSGKAPLIEPPSEQPEDIAPLAPPPVVEHEVNGGWRGDLARWARSTQHRTRPTRDGLDVIAARLGLDDRVRHALALLYGAHLGGVRISAYDLSNALDWDWREALGDGALAASDLVRWRDRDIRLCRELVAVLDDRPPLHGTIASALQSSSMGAVAIVAPPEIEPARVGAWAAPSIGALLVPDEAGRRRGRAFVREARIRGLTPLLPWTDFSAALRVPPESGAVVVEHPATAASLQLPIVATWSA